MSKLLAARIKQFDIPEFEEQMIRDNVAIYRLNGDEHEKTAGGLYIPETARDYKNQGVLISAGLKAMDELHSDGIDLGHIVSFGRYAGDEKMVERQIGTSGRTVLICKYVDITSSKDLHAEIEAGQKRILRDDDEESKTCGTHYIDDISEAA